MKTFNILTIITALLFTSLVSAHSGLKDSIPENGAMLTKLPENLMLEFTMQVKLVKLQLMDQSGKKIKFKSKASKDFENTFNLVLPTLDSGRYNVKWLVMGKDAHKMKGDFTFMLHAPDMKKMQMPVSASDLNTKQEP